MNHSQYALVLGVSLLIATSTSAQTAPDPENVEVVIVPAGDKLLRWQGQPGRTYFI